MGFSLNNPFEDIKLPSISELFGGPSSIFHKPFGSGAEAPPPPIAPDPGQITQQALQTQLNQELNLRRSSAMATDGQGLLQVPKTQSAGQLLLGS